MLIEHWQWLISALHSCCEVWRKNERQVGSRRADPAAPVSFLSEWWWGFFQSTRFFFLFFFLLFKCQKCNLTDFSSHASGTERQHFICCKLGNQYDNPAPAIMPVQHLIKVHISSKIKRPLCVRASPLSEVLTIVKKPTIFPWFPTPMSNNVTMLRVTCRRVSLYRISAS